MKKPPAKKVKPVWCEGGVMSRDSDAVECPACGGFAPEMENIPDDVRREAIAQDCGRGRMCCTAAFQCKKCKQIVLAHLPAPEME